MKNLSKTTYMNILGTALCLVAISFLTGCNDDPKKENTPEVVTTAILIFTPEVGEAIVVTAYDPDGDGIQNSEIDEEIDLDVNTEYVLTIELINDLAEGDESHITAEVMEEGDEHQFFFGWTGNTFSDPAGSGNIDNNGEVRYEGGFGSLDENGLPLGLTTTWTTSVNATTGTFRVLLKHQPDEKSETSDWETGESDLDITFDINVED